MTDNINVTPGSGAVVAADDIAGVLYQRVKLGLGADGAAVDAVAGAGVVGTGVQRVTLASDDPAVVALQLLANGHTLTDRSGTITTGGTAQTLMAANASRKGWAIQNVSSGDLWVNELGSTALLSQPSIKIASGNLYESPLGGSSTAAISIIGATTAQAFTAREW
jgi:hypothetical protein